jgi:hypothetical protein
MEVNTNPSTGNEEEQSEDEELEKDFLKIDMDELDKIYKNKEILSNYELEIKEIMKIGCNRQIAEYSLLKNNIESILEKENSKYIKERNNLLKEITKKLGYKIKALIKDLVNTENIICAIEDSYYEELPYEEIIDLIIEKYEKEIPVEVYKYVNFKENLKKLIKDNDEYIGLNKFIEIKKEYIKQREPLIEAALRLVKKIINDENEYNKFYNEFYKNKSD